MHLQAHRGAAWRIGAGKLRGMALNRVPIPEPWGHVRFIVGDEAKELEQRFGSGLTADDLDPAELVDEYGDGKMLYPTTRRARVVAWHRWAELDNSERGTRVYLRLQRDTEGGAEQYVSAVVFPHGDFAEPLTGADLRSLPLTAIAAAYSWHEAASMTGLKTGFALSGEAAVDPLEPLPPASATDRFSARVAIQFRALEEAHPSENTARKLAELNDTSLPTAQRWIARARKAGFLAPAMPKGHRYG